VRVPWVKSGVGANVSVGLTVGVGGGGEMVGGDVSTELCIQAPRIVENPKTRLKRIINCLIFVSGGVILDNIETIPGFLTNYKRGRFNPV
jgi:hypothetical protein